MKKRISRMEKIVTEKLDNLSYLTLNPLGFLYALLCWVSLNTLGIRMPVIFRIILCMTVFMGGQQMDRLTELLIPMLKNSENVLDFGCGDGMIDKLILKQKKDLRIKGIDVLVRPETYIDVIEFDGKTIPYGDDSFDTVMAIDVLHHTDDPSAAFAEMVRVSSKYIVIKDHVRSGLISYLKLRVMDYVGNAHYHVRLPYNYLTVKQWKDIFKQNNLIQDKITRKLNLYTGIFHFLFDARLHFIAVLEKKNG